MIEFRWDCQKLGPPCVVELRKSWVCPIKYLLTGSWRICGVSLSASWVQTCFFRLVVCPMKNKTRPTLVCVVSAGCVIIGWYLFCPPWLTRSPINFPARDIAIKPLPPVQSWIFYDSFSKDIHLVKSYQIIYYLNHPNVSIQMSPSISTPFQPNFSSCSHEAWAVSKDRPARPRGSQSI